TSGVHAPGRGQCAPERELRPLRDALLHKPLFIRPDELGRTARHRRARAQEVAAGVTPDRSCDIEDAGGSLHHPIDGELREVANVYGLKAPIRRCRSQYPSTSGDTPQPPGQAPHVFVWPEYDVWPDGQNLVPEFALNRLLTPHLQGAVGVRIPPPRTWIMVRVPGPKR